MHYNLELDIWLPELNKAIEFGASRYHNIKYQQWKDAYKKQWCIDHGIKLLVIDYDIWIKHKDFSIIDRFILTTV